MARRTPARDRRGRFVKKSSRKRSTRRRRRNPSRRVTAGARDTRGRFKSRGSSTRRKRRRTYRRNPPRPDLLNLLMNGTVEAVEIIAGKAGTRMVPGLLNLPRTGNVGLAVQAAVAVALGYLAGMVGGAGVGSAVLAGGLTAPLEDLAVRFSLPGSTLLAPMSTGGTTGIYAAARPRALPPGGGMRGWVTSPPGSGIEDTSVYSSILH